MEGLRTVVQPHFGILLLFSLRGGVINYGELVYEEMDGVINYPLDYPTLLGALLQGVHYSSRLHGVSRFNTLSTRFQHSIRHCPCGHAD